MSEAEFAAYRRRLAEEYAADMVDHGGMTPEAARRKAEADDRRLLPEGLATPGHAVVVLVREDDGVEVGRMWIGEQDVDGRPGLFLHNIAIEPTFQGRGLGREAMLLLEAEARRREVEQIGLNVFSGNARARALYRSLGYRESAVQMSKDLTGPPDETPARVRAKR